MLDAVAVAMPDGLVAMTVTVVPALGILVAVTVVTKDEEADQVDSQPNSTN